MESPEYESAPESMSSVRRYYSDLNLKRVSYVDLQITAERLLDQEGLGNPGRSYEALYGSVLPTPNEFADDAQVGFNRFATFPLDVIGSLVDATYEPADLRDWYNDAAEHVRIVTKYSNTDTCYSVASEESNVCQHGYSCPRHIMATRLISPVAKANFDAIEYLVDPFRARAVAIEKFDVAKRLAMIMVNDYLSYMDEYMADFNARFGPEPLIK